MGAEIQHPVGLSSVSVSPDKFGVLAYSPECRSIVSSPADVDLLSDLGFAASPGIPRFLSIGLTESRDASTRVVSLFASSSPWPEAGLDL